MAAAGVVRNLGLPEVVWVESAGAEPYEPGQLDHRFWRCGDARLIRVPVKPYESHGLGLTSSFLIALKTRWIVETTTLLDPSIPAEVSLSTL